MAIRTFENGLTRLEKITEELEAGDLSLDVSLKKFNEGIELAEFCNRELSEARAKVELLLNKNGKLESVPFTSDSAEHGNQTVPE